LDGYSILSHRLCVTPALLPLDDCLYALQATIPSLTRSALHRCQKRHGINRLPEMTGDKPQKKKFKAYPIGYFHIDIAEVHTEEGKSQLFVAMTVPASLPMPSCIRTLPKQLLLSSCAT
jgi:hypothetical protein